MQSAAKKMSFASPAAVNEKVKTVGQAEACRCCTHTHSSTHTHTDIPTQTEEAAAAAALATACVLPLAWHKLKRNSNNEKRRAGEAQHMLWQQERESGRGSGRETGRARVE